MEGVQHDRFHTSHGPTLTLEMVVAGRITITVPTRTTGQLILEEETTPPTLPEEGPHLVEGLRHPEPLHLTIGALPSYQKRKRQNG